MTGVGTDRLSVERARGITIDLIAYRRVAEGETFSGPGWGVHNVRQGG